MRLRDDVGFDFVYKVCCSLVKIGWDVLVELGMSDFELKESYKLSDSERKSMKRRVQLLSTLAINSFVSF